VAHATVIPPYSEQVIFTQPKRVNAVSSGHICCIQPVNRFAQNTGLALGGTLVKSHPRRIPVLVINPTDTPISLAKGTVAGHCLPAVTMKAAPVSSNSDSSTVGTAETTVAFADSPRTQETTGDRGIPRGPRENTPRGPRGHTPRGPRGTAPRAGRDETDHGNHGIDASTHRSKVSSLPGPPGIKTVTPGGANIKLPDHIKQMIPKTRLTGLQQTEVRQLLADYTDVFMSPDGQLGNTSVAKHTINLTDERPFRQRLRRAALVHQDVIDKEVHKMLDTDIIEPSDSPWASPVVMVKKKDGTWRFCIDYRKLNSLTRKDSYPLPHIEDTLDALAGSHYFCALDLASGYWQVQVAQEDKPKTAFVTKQGLYQFNVMPFGLCNAPATFERLMEMVLKGFLWKRCMVYIDDVVVYGRTFRETLDNFKLVLDRIRAAGLKLKPSKCDLFAKEILYLGFMVTGKGIRPDPAKIECVRKWPRPCNVSDIRSFLGFASYHRRFIRGFAEIARPLTKLTEKKAEFIWEAPQEKAFLQLRLHLSTAPVLNHPLPNKEFILDTDASNYAVGGVLSQVIDGKEQVIAFASTALSRPEMNYCTTHRELLAVVTMTKRFRHYLLGRHFKLRTDHSSLRWLLNYKDIDGMLARWLVKLQEYDMAVEHRPGKIHLNADGLSRCHKCANPKCVGAYQHDAVVDSEDDDRFEPNRGMTGRRTPRCHAGSARHRWSRRKRQLSKRENYEDLETGIPAVDSLDPASMPHLHHYARVKATQLDEQIDELPWLGGYTARELAVRQRADTALLPIITALEENVRPAHPRRFTFCEETQSLASRWEQLRLQDGLLYRCVQPASALRPVMQLILPAALRTEVLHQLHDLRVTGHLGIQRTVARVQQRFYWPGCSLDVARWCAACPQCAARKGKPAPGRAPMTTVKSGAPFDRIALDILDTHRPTVAGNRYILVVSDYFTKWTDAFPLRRHTARLVAKLVVNRWFLYHGTPKQIHSDQGAEFESRLFRQLANMLGSTKVRTSPYRPQSDGQVERMNRTILNMLSAFVSDRINDWDEHLGFALSAYRSSVHASTGCTPFAMVYGREQNLPVDLMYPTAAETGPQPQCGPEYVEWVRRALAASHNFARAHLDKAAVRQKRGYDAHAKERPGFKENEKVRYYYPPCLQGNKFAKPWIGPFTIIKKVTDVDYRIRRDSQPDRVLVTHVDNLKPYEGPLRLDINLQTLTPDEIPLLVTAGQPPQNGIDELMQNLEIPTELSPVINDSTDSESEDLPTLPRRPQRLRHPPVRFGWD